MKLGDTCVECGTSGAGPRQLCAPCEQLYPLNDNTPAREPAFGDDICPCGCND